MTLTIEERLELEKKAEYKRYIKEYRRKMKRLQYEQSGGYLERMPPENCEDQWPDFNH